MKIKKLEFLSFGRLLNKKISLSTGVNIIFGKNESGKSTIAEGIVTLLYGIYPTTKGKNLLVNWDQKELSISGLIENDHEVYEITRTLMSQPVGSVKKNSEIKQINNNTLQFMNRIPLALYRDLYCLDTRIIDQLQMDTWEKIDSQMIFSYSQTSINKPEDVLKEIDEELNQIWRESNRGNYRLKIIEEEINQLKSKKSEFVSIYKDTKKDIEAIDGLKRLIKKQENQLQDLEVKRRKIKKILPIANICIEKENLKKNYENYSKYRLISKDTIDNQRVLTEQIKNIKKEILALEESIEKKALEKNEFSEKEELINKNKDDIQQRKVELKKLLSQKKNIDALETKEQLILDEYNQLFYKIFNKICTTEDFNKIKKTSIKEINQKSMNKKLIIVSVLSFIIGGLSYYYNQLFISIFSFSASIALMLTLFLNKNNKKELNGLTFTLDSIDNFRKLKEKEFQLLTLLNEKKQLTQVVEKKANELKLFFNPYIKSVDLNVVLDYFDKVFQVIQRKSDENNSLAFIVKEFEISLEHKNRVLRDYNKKLDRINSFFIELSDASIEKGIEIFRNNLKIEDHLEHLDEKIDTIENGQLLLAEYKALKEPVSSEKLNSLEIKIDELNKQVRDHQVTLARLEEKTENVSITEEIQSIDTEIELLMIEKKELINRKNQLLAMKEIIQKSNDAFKADYQPNIIKDANDYFNAFTQSKYDKILIDSETKEIYLDLGKYNKEINSGFSRGTMDQLFLALRLGVIKHYERDIRFPILLDEFFSNWDQERLIEFIKVLKVIQNERQVIIMTCKNNIVNTLSNFMAINMIRIEGEGNE